MTPLTALILLPLIGLAAFRLARALTRDSLTEPLRDVIWRYCPPEASGFRGRVGYFFTCPWCTGFWSAISLVLFYVIVPLPALTLAIILALAASAVAGLVATWEDR